MVLAVGDDNELARSMAESVVLLPDATGSVRVIVTHVFKDIEAPPSASAQELPRHQDVEEQIDKDVQPESVKEVIDVLAKHGIENDIRTKRGNPADEIVRIADESGAENIYIGGKRRSPAGKMLFGSTTQAVLFGTDRPVTVFGSPD